MRTRLAIILCVISCGTTSLLQADVVTNWDTILNNAIKTDTANPSTTMPGPGWASRNMAMVTAAIGDAVDNAAGSFAFTPYAYSHLTPTASPTVAASQAAYDVLVNLYPTQKALFDVDLGNSVSGITGQALTDGQTLGHAVASAILAKRANDGSNVSVNYTVAGTIGTWAPDPLHPNQSAWGPNWGNVTPFVLNSTQQANNANLIKSQINSLVPGATSLASPAFLSSPAFAAAYNQVMSLGASNSTTRTQAQTNIGYFWAYDQGGIGPPTVLYNQVLQTIANQQNNTLAQNARLFALANMAMADASIACWQCKYDFNFWRPVTAIRSGNQMMNPGSAFYNPNITAFNANWTPLGAPNGIPGLTNNDPFTPPFPSFTSGHASFGGALFTMLADFYGTDHMNFTLTSDNLPGVTESFTSFSAAAQQNADSRIYLGIHYQFDADIGTASGDMVGNDVYANAMAPVPEPSALALVSAGILGLIGVVRSRTSKTPCC